MYFGVARWSLGGSRGPGVMTGGCPIIMGNKIEVFGSLSKSSFCPLARGSFKGSSIRLSNWTPSAGDKSVVG